MFQTDIDPWDYASSPFEARKRKILLNACGAGVRGRGLELACANGETTRYLARKCLRLMAVDSSPTAVAEARRRTEVFPHVSVHQAVLPRDLPRKRFDLIVVSELLYYIRAVEADCLVSRLARAIAPGGRIILLHHHVRFEDASQHSDRAQQRAASQLGRTMIGVFHHRDARFDCVAFSPRIG